MAESSVILSTQLEQSVDRLFAKIESLKSLNKELEAKVQSLTKEAEIARQDATAARRELECCKLGNALRGSGNNTSGLSTDEAKRRISQIVREIDKCIALLKQ